MNSLITAFNDKLSNYNKSSDLELEITYHIVNSVDLYKDIFNKLKDLSDNISIIENLDIYYENGTRVTKVFKEGQNQNSDIVIKKKSILKPFIFKSSINNISHYRLKLNKEEIVNINTLSSIKLIRLKLRASFILKNDKQNYKIDLDLIKNIDPREKHIKEIKNLIFKQYKISNFVENIPFSLFDDIILETEFNNDIISENDIDNSINFIRSLFESNINNEYQKYIYKIAKNIITNRSYLENFKQKSGLKKLLNNVIEVDSESYFKQIYPQILNYYVTDKIDGQRCICYIQEYDNKMNIKLLTNKIFSIKEYNEEIIYIKQETKNPDNIIKTTILDCEILLDDKLKEFDEISINDIFVYVFDIITIENIKIAMKPFEDRLESLSKGFLCLCFSVIGVAPNPASVENIFMRLLFLKSSIIS